MKNILYNTHHVMEYLMYGFGAAIFYIIPTWYYLQEADYRNGWLVYTGSVLFMLVIMLYSLKLSRTKPEYKSSWMMIIAGNYAVFTGVVLSAVLVFLLCFLYIPGFMTGNSPGSFLAHAPGGLNNKNMGTVFQVFIPATIVNFGIGGCIAVLGPYVFKLDQTKDKPAVPEPGFK